MDKPTNAILLRQLKRLGLSEDSLPTDLQTWRDLLERVAKTYTEADDDHYRLERSLELSSSEMRQLNDNLRASEAQIRLERDKLQAVFRSIGDGLCTLDKDGNLLSINPAAAYMLDWTLEDLLGQPILEKVLVSSSPLPQSEAAESPIQMVIRVGRSYRNEDAYFRKRDGSLLPVSFVLDPIVRQGLGEITGVVLAFRDISDYKDKEEELRAAKDAAEAASRAKSTFLANMSHELRTPLNAVIGYCEILQDEVQDLGYTQFLPDLDKINKAARQLLVIISDILDLSKIEAGKMELSLDRFDVAELIESISSTMKPVIAQKHNTVDLKYENIGGMYADATKIRQVLLNLLSNAAKFTEAGKITLAAERIMQRNGEVRREWIVFRVTDTGMGISPDQQRHLFEPFTQGDASLSRKYGGTGLGLTICRHFCQMMGGEIDVTSQSGIGSTFTVKIPAEVSEAKRKRSTGELLGLQPPDAVPTPEAAAQSQANIATPATGVPIIPTSNTTSSYIVLVIDDDETIHDQMKRILTKEGYRVIGASNGKDGIELARRLRPNVITLDVLMPDMNGWAVLSVLKADTSLQHIPVILVTMVDTKDVGFTLGASDFLLKPIERQSLLKLLSNYRSRSAAFQNATPAVLVVEDDAPNRELLVRMLADEGWTVSEAENGRAALERVAVSQPDIIFLDLMMPEMDGFQFLTELRQNETWQAIPVVVVTAMVLSAEDMQRLNANVQQILQKSAYTREQLLQEVQKLVHQFVPLPPPQA